MAFGKNLPEVTFTTGLVPSPSPPSSASSPSPSPPPTSPIPERSPSPEVDIKKFILGNMRRTSSVKGERPFPYIEDTTPFIWLGPTGEIKTATALMPKTELLTAMVKLGGVVLAVWPGRYRSDVFVVDSPRAALDALRAAYEHHRGPR